MALREQHGEGRRGERTSPMSCTVRASGTAGTAVVELKLKGRVRPDYERLRMPWQRLVWILSVGQ